jgi:hypothetical protein
MRATDDPARSSASSPDAAHAKSTSQLPAASPLASFSKPAWDGSAMWSAMRASETERAAALAPGAKSSTTIASPAMTGLHARPDAGSAASMAR